MRSILAPRLILVMMVAGCRDGTGPVPPGTDRFSAIVPGGTLTCAVGLDDHAYCWGQNDFGQVGSRSVGECLDTGMNPVACATRPQRVPLDGPVAMVSTGSAHACALMDDGGAYCWGLNSAGQLGGTTAAQSRQPVRVNVAVAFTDIHVGPEHSCGLDGTGTAWCWGVNDYGQLGRGASDMDAHPEPMPIVSALRFVSFARGFSQTTCALAATGAAYCWGPNDGGQPPGMGVLGDTARDECLANPFLRFGTECNTTPRRAMPNLEFDEITVGLVHGCGRTGGEWICWGVALGGALGIGEPQDCVTVANGIEHHQPCNRDRVPVTGGESLASLSAGSVWSCAIDADGRGWCWGMNFWGSLGTGIAEHSSDVPVRIASDVTLASIAVGSVTACALDAEGFAWCWGYARSGAIGDGTFGESPALEPRAVGPRAGS